jgi:hypothetical protein
MGYEPDLKLLGQCRIKSLHADFPEDGIPKLVIKALGGESFLAVEPETADERLFASLSNADFIKKVAEKFEMDPISVAAPGNPTTYIQRGKTYLDTVKELAKQLAFEFYVRFDETKDKYELHFHPSGYYKEPQQPSYLLTYGMGEKSTLTSFSPTEDGEGQITELEFVAWDQVNKRAVVLKLKHTKEKGLDITVERGTSNMDLEGPVLDGSAVRLQVFGKHRLTTLQNAYTLDGLKAFSEKKFKEYKEGYVTGTGALVGAETLRPGQIHKVKGVGRFEGDYYLTQVSHKFGDDGFKTGFSAYREFE